MQDHQLATYQSLGQLSGIDLQYSSLQAYPEPIVTGTWGVNSNTGTGRVHLLHDRGDRQRPLAGQPDHDHRRTGQRRLHRQRPGGDRDLVADGIEPVTLTMTKNLTGGGTSTDNFSASLMLVNASSSPYGAGWSIGGLQQITVGTAGSTLMIADGTNAPEEFTSSDGVNYTGFATDTSTLTYSSSSHTYTRAYHDGRPSSFNSSGQETSITDGNGNTTSYAYVTSGAAGAAAHDHRPGRAGHDAGLRFERPSEHGHRPGGPGHDLHVRLATATSPRSRTRRPRRRSTATPRTTR